MNERTKDKIYSESENKYINVLDVEKIVVEDDELTNIGYFKITLLLRDHEKGWESFTGKIDEDGWTSDGLRGLAKVKNSELEKYRLPERCSVVELGDLHVKPDTSKNEADMWRDMWEKIEKRANKLAKDIKNTQLRLIESRKLNTIHLSCY